MNVLVLLNEFLEILLQYLPVAEVIKGQHEEIPHRLGRLVAGRLVFLVRQARVRQPGTLKDAADHATPFGKRGEWGGASRAALSDPLVNERGNGGEQFRTVLAYPSLDVVVPVAMAVDIIRCESQADAATAAFDVRLPGGVVGRE